MSWFNVWDGLKNKTCRYLLQRYLGQFLDEKLNLEQLNIELYNGKATIKSVSLRVEALNELLDAQGWPFEFTDGQIGLLTVSVPWNALMTNDSSIEASDVVLCLRPVKRAHECHESMIESMWSSVSSSLQLAEECMRQEEEDESANTSSGGETGAIVGLEKFAETIDNVLNRIQAKFSNITLKIEYPCHYRLKGVALNIHLNELFYKNETGNEKMPQMFSADSNTQSEILNRLPTYAKHNVKLSGVSMFTEENWVSEEEIGVQHENVPILQFMGQQNLQIKVKQSEEITGPKICFDMELGAICAIFSPRQLQLLTHILEAFSEEETCSAVKQHKDAVTNYPEDYGIQQQQLHEQFSGSLAQGNLNMWNYPPPNVMNVIKPTPTNFYGHRETYCDSLVSSSLSSSTITSVSRYQRKPTNMDSCAEISNFVIKISALVAVILHEDILVESQSNSYQHFWNERSLKELLRVSQKFFEYSAIIPVEREFDNENSYCSKNHIFLRLNPIVAEGKQNRNKNILQLTTTISATKAELCEVLEDQVTHLLKFNRNKNCFNGYQIRPEFTMNFSTSNSIQTKKNSRTNIEIILEENILEFDITIIDRLGSFFIPSPYKNLSAVGNSSAKDDLMSKTEFSVNCSLVDVKLRFPIVDLRPLHDPNRVPWWKQNIRSDYLLLKFSEFKLIFCESRVKLYASQIEIFYAESDDVQNHLLTASYQKLPHSKLDDRPRIIIDFAERNYASLEAGCEPKLPFSSKRHCRQSSTSAYANKMDNDLTENILLPGEKHEIDDFCKSTMENSEIQVQLNFPVVDFFLESKQLYELIYNRLNSDLFMWEPSCPYITKTSTLETQPQMGQSLLNMSLMDSVYISAIAQSDEFSQSYEQQTQSLSSNPAPVILEQSDQSDDNREQDEDVDDEDDDGISCRQQPPKTFAAKISHHNCSVEIKLGKVSGSCFVPVRDNDKHVLPQVCGKFLLNLEKVNIFLVAGFKNDMNLSYLCTQIKSGEVYHCGIVPMNTPLRFDHQAQVEDFMQSTLYKIPFGLTKGIQVNGEGNGGDADMFSVVIEMKKNPIQKIKRLKITAGIHYTTLRYNPSSASLYWLNQLIDFLDVLDYPIEGYKPYSVLSEMQLHLWDCAIDFRPENFCYRAVLELFYFSVCSNIIPSMPCCNLRFVLEECVLSLAPYDESTHKKYPCFKISFINSQNLVPVLDVGLLDISLRLNDDETTKCPTFDLRCSIHDVHFRTCFDSGSAFAQLIGYIASSSNASNDQQYPKEQSLQSSLSSESDFFLSQTDQQLTKEITKKQQERVNILMAEAVQESPVDTRNLETIDEEEHVRGKDELKVFYFPDENNRHLDKKESSPEIETGPITKSAAATKDQTNEEPLPIIKAEFGEVTEEDDTPLFEDLHNGSSNEEDYCIIAGEENAFVNPHFASGSIEVSDDPLMIVDNHFCLPSSSSSDLLRTPSNFPIPEQRYTLCEMTVTWHLYGGHDFPSNPTAASINTTKARTATSEETSANKTAMSETYRQGVFYANESCRLQQIKKPKEKITWKSMGGCNRNHEVLVEMQFTKVRFSYEIYPRHTSYASRQVLLVNEIEIRDRLQSSEINKFLYNANTKSFSNRRSQHMVEVKAIHVRTNPQQSNNQECSLRISLSPLRVHIDQDTLEFLTDFFTNFGKSCDKDNSSDAKTDEDKHAKLAVAKTEVPIMTISEDEQELPDAVQDLRARRIVNENISLLIDEQEGADNKSIKSDNSTIMASQEINTAPVYFREIIFTPDVSIRFDYHGRRVELSKGPIAGLLMGLGQLQCSEIILRKITYRRGLLGFEKVCNFLCKEWLRDIKRNQLPKILSGVGPTYAFVQLFQGIYDLFWLPIEHYQKDGRLIRGLQLGAQSFSARTILAALEITSRLIQLLQFTAETAFDMVSSGPSVRQSKKNKRGRKKRHRPKDIREGVANAYHILKEGINDSANNLIETAAAEHDQKGLTGAVGAVMRQVPQLVVCPAVLATQATTNILGGVKSSLVPEAKLEAKEKWKDDNC
ncbi:autophagy-related 2 [Cochliomyia hominivorax]